MKVQLQKWLLKLLFLLLSSMRKIRSFWFRKELLTMMPFLTTLRSAQEIITCLFLSLQKQFIVYHNYQVVNKAKQERIFNIKIGDQVIHKVDIFGEAGYGNILHKWTSFDLRQDIIYLNKTYPALNAYIFTKRLLKVTFEKVKGIPKIDALILVRGQDAQKFLNHYISFEQSKNMIIREYVSQKYHIIPKNNFKKMQNRLDFVRPDQGLFTRYIENYIWKALVGALGVLFLIFHEQLYAKLNLWQGKSKQLDQNRAQMGFGKLKTKDKHD